MSFSAIRHLPVGGKRLDRSAKPTPRQLAAEKIFGIRFVEFRRLAAGNTAKNYKAVAEDGKAYFVKSASAADVDSLIQLYASLCSPLVPKVAFGGKTGDFDGERMFAMDWVDGGVSVDPENLNQEQMDSLLLSYDELSLAMGEGMIHGDIHYNNILFKGNRVVSFLDFEMMRRGEPTDDLLRVFIHALERTRFWRVRRISKIESNFRTLVGRSKYSKELWLGSIDRHEQRKNARRKKKSRFGWAKAIECKLRSPLYVKMRSLVTEAK